AERPARRRVRRRLVGEGNAAVDLRLAGIVGVALAVIVEGDPDPPGVLGQRDAVGGGVALGAGLGVDLGVRRSDQLVGGQGEDGVGARLHVDALGGGEPVEDRQRRFAGVDRWRPRQRRGQTRQCGDGHGHPQTTMTRTTMTRTTMTQAHLDPPSSRTSVGTGRCPLVAAASRASRLAAARPDSRVSTTSRSGAGTGSGPAAPAGRRRKLPSPSGRASRTRTTMAPPSSWGRALADVWDDFTICGPAMNSSGPMNGPTRLPSPPTTVKTRTLIDMGTPTA